MKTLKQFLYLFAFSVILISCNQNKKEHHHEGGNADSGNPNQALYDQVMDIHDEVMPKMQDIYELKRKLQDSLAVASEDKKIAYEQRIAALDSADHLMMDWMHKFNPLPDSADQEEAREYLESEMEKIKKVKEAMLEVIAKEKGN